MKGKKKTKKKQVPREGATMHQEDTAAVSIKVHKRIRHETLFKGYAQKMLCVCDCVIRSGIIWSWILSK